ncbi:hypothetical protein [Snodgrassella sp. CFCC 13594]|uniref:hypothetical protein n=1 Tax=Snodgrassella sp. CFCC 13594 TaxID=1775559 RepID=UPI0008321AE5|nr:hypothetical protein [Snodgrassella sp. CFCC 13594]
MNKQAMMQAVKDAFNVDALKKIDGIEPLELYVKTLSVKGFNDRLKELQAIDDKYKDDDLNAIRGTIVSVFDKDGNHPFDADNLDDVNFMANLPIGIYTAIVNASNGANSWGLMKA